eukprot:TRINITY_DN159237_c0_g1_i1.p1 TRINITY_DN159237_c0_g1~~TRINITY_DN159237_c0_g1_i1.p1  ORF type:complete len:113 (+),score=1.11 TRINITY_DN159237_c0_g1_i1:108-446(+)
MKQTIFWWLAHSLSGLFYFTNRLWLFLLSYRSIMIFMKTASFTRSVSLQYDAGYRNVLIQIVTDVQFYNKSMFEKCIHLTVVNFSTEFKTDSDQHCPNEDSIRSPIQVLKVC